MIRTYSKVQLLVDISEREEAIAKMEKQGYEFIDAWYTPNGLQLEITMEKYFKFKYKEREEE